MSEPEAQSLAFKLFFCLHGWPGSCDKEPEKTSLGRKGLLCFVVVSGFSPQSLDSVASRPECGQVEYQIAELVVEHSGSLHGGKEAEIHRPKACGQDTHFSQWRKLLIAHSAIGLPVGWSADEIITVAIPPPFNSATSCRDQAFNTSAFWGDVSYPNQQLRSHDCSGAWLPSLSRDCFGYKSHWHNHAPELFQ